MNHVEKAKNIYLECFKDYTSREKSSPMKITGRELAHALGVSTKTHREVELNGCDQTIVYHTTSLDEMATHLDIKTNVMYIVFDGTDTREGLNEWISNAKYGLNKNGLHKGFAEAHQKFQPILKEIWKSCTEDNVLIRCVGYSRGGPLAILAADYFSALDNEQGIVEYREAVVFGSPRFCNEEAARKLSNEVEVTRVEACGDWVPRIPFKFRYKHVMGSRISVGKWYQWLCVPKCIRYHKSYWTCTFSGISG